MAIYNEETKQSLCECGCGKEVDPWNSFRNGHWNKTEEGSNKLSEAHSGMCYLLDEGHSEKMTETQLKSYRDDPTRADRQSSTLSGLVRGSKDIENKRLAGLEFYRSEEGKRKKEMMSVLFSGEGNPSWKGGHDYNYGYGWSAIREFILIRDNFICQGCGQGYDLEAHHIDGYIFNVDKTNLITVCHDCNMKAASRYREEYWFNYYTNRIKEIYKEVTYACR